MAKIEHTLIVNGEIIKDRREYLRIKYSNQIILYTNNSEYVLDIEDISFNGVKLKKSDMDITFAENKNISATFLDNTVLENNEKSLICNVDMRKYRESNDYVVFKIVNSSPIFKQFYSMLVARHYKYCH